MHYQKQNAITSKAITFYLLNTFRSEQLIKIFIQDITKKKQVISYLNTKIKLLHYENIYTRICYLEIQT